jgi:PAS domain S-box-containing protein
MSAHTENIQPITPPAAGKDGVLRLLVVEDSDADYELLLLLLRKSGFAPAGMRVENETEMRQVLDSRNWDLVIADNHLPAFSAEAALRVLREMRLDLPFIIVSGAMQEEAAIAAMLAGADDYITKSRLARLVPAIERSLRAAESRRLQREAEQALRGNIARLQGLAANIPGMLFEARFIEKELRFLYVSEGSQSLLGIAPAVLQEVPGLLLQLIDPADRDALLERLETTSLMPGIIQWEGRARASGEDGSMRWIQIGASPSLGPDGLLRWTGVITDISALKRAEQELGQSRDELRALSAHLAQIRESERARIAREIHDDIGGLLTGLRADLSWLKRRVGGDPAIGEKLSYMNELVDSAAGASMRIVRDLRPAVLDFGFAYAMHWLATDFNRHSDMNCEFACNNEEADIDRERAAPVFRIFQELLTNITKHSGARQVRANLNISDETVSLEVQDDGIGIARPDRRRAESFGIRGMQERALELGGSFSIEPLDAGGTLARLEVPRQGPAGNV